MKSEKKMMCPLTGGIIDSDLCYDVQECIEGNIPVTLEFEDFLEQGDCEKICHECEYNILSDQWTNYEPSDMDAEESESVYVYENGNKNLEKLVKGLEQYKIQLEKTIQSEHGLYEKMTTDWQESEEGQKKKKLLNILQEGINHYDDSIRTFKQYMSCKEAIMDISKNECRKTSLSNEKCDQIETNTISYDDLANKLQDNIQVMMSTFRFCGLDKPIISCSVMNFEGQGIEKTKLIIHVELSSTNGKPVKESFVLKIYLYSSESILLSEDEIDVPAGSFKGYNTYRFCFDNCNNLGAIAYGRVFISKF